MRFRLSLKNTAAALLVTLLLNSCSSPPIEEKEITEESITKAIVDIGKNEYGMDLKSWLVGRTLWVYLPLENLFDEEFKAADEALRKIQGARLGIFRVALNAKDKIDFCVFAFCDISLGYDYFEIMTFLDMKKLWFGYISRGDFRSRVVLKEGLNQEAINDKAGKHIQPFDAAWAGFLVTQLQQRIKSYFAEDLKDDFKLNDIKIGFNNGNMIVELDSEKLSENNIAAADSVLKIIARAINNYDFKDFVLLEFNDINSGEKTTYSRQALLGLVK